MTEVTSFCRFCGSFCGILVDVEDGRVGKIRGNPRSPSGRGYTCPKGRALGDFHAHPDRLDRPRCRAGGALQETTWPVLVDDLAFRLRSIAETDGPDAVGFFFGTAGMLDSLGFPTAGALVAAMGTASRYSTLTIDSPSVLLAAESIAGHPMLLPGPDPDAELVLWLGGNPVISHGHGYFLGMPVDQLRRWAGQGQLWVVDPRRTETADLATRHLPIRAGTDYALLAYLVRELLTQGADHEYLSRRASGIDILAGAVAPYDLTRTTRLTGLAESQLTELLDQIRRAGRIAVKESTGLTFQASANVCMWLIWALNIITQSHDRPGGMFFNPGYLRKLHTQEWPAMDGTPGPGPRSRPELPARWGEFPCTALASEIESGNLKALVVVGGNPLTAIPQPERLARAFSTLRVLAVSDVVGTAVTRHATHLMPSTGQLERADIWPLDFLHSSVANQYTPAVLPAGADRRPTWWQMAALGAALGHQVLPGGADPDEMTEERLARAYVEAAGGDFDQFLAQPDGVSDHRIHGWVENKLPGGRWRLGNAEFAAQLAALTEADSRETGLRLISRRQRHHLNSQLADGTGARRPDRPTVDLHPDDAARNGVEDGQYVRVRTEHGELTLTARVDDRLTHGTISVPHGFTNHNVGALTSDETNVDELTGLPLMTAIPATIAPAGHSREPEKRT
ncbi:molybdopterin-containing oxidoreductase family protein [Sciscionella sediminilitoris]|uniref:molybdopterin-containing oxidoreductase family protein n=1 Tax=Sciscionella sediminilitoris TaxID=1445613 RepID=UPI0004DF85A2|nr:molybdopterin dinucleotide binding domain-containing protein [Sciscionella sp. SE31]